MSTFAFIQSSVVNSRLEWQNVAVLLKYWDERYKIWSLQPVFIQIVGLAIAGSHHDHAVLEKFREKSLQNHCIGDIGDLEFVKAD